jgi:tetratricopeptide (TPR) repeat protein
MIGLAYYAVEDFVAAKKCWNKAMDSLKKTKKTSATLRAELLNNLGCIHYEIGNETNAVKMFQESLVIQREAVISDVYDNGKAPNKSMLMKLATIQANIAYVHLRSKNVDAAISSFESCRKVCLLFCLWFHL